MIIRSKQWIEAISADLAAGMGQGRYRVIGTVVDSSSQEEFYVVEDLRSSATHHVPVQAPVGLEWALGSGCGIS